MTTLAQLPTIPRRTQGEPLERYVDRLTLTLEQMRRALDPNSAGKLGPTLYDATGKAPVRPGYVVMETANIQELAVTTAKIDDLAVTNAKVKDMSADKITTGTLSAETEITVGEGEDGSAITLSGADRQIRVADTAGTARVVIGALGDDYGIVIRDDAGKDIVTATGLGLEVVAAEQVVPWSIGSPQLTKTGVSEGEYGGTGAVVPNFYVGADGRIVDASDLPISPITIANSAGTAQFTVAPGQALRFSGSGVGYSAGTRTVNISSGASNTGVVAGGYGDGVTVGYFYVGADGRIYEAGNVPIAGISICDGAGAQQFKVAPLQSLLFDGPGVSFDPASKKVSIAGGTGGGSETGAQGSAVANATITHPSQSFTGNGSTAAYALTGFGNLLAGTLTVAIDGILQHADAYSLSGSTLTFTAAPPAGAAIYVRGAATTVVTQLNALLASLRAAGLLAT